MNKYLKIGIIILITVLVVVLGFLSTGKAKYESISYEDYDNLEGSNLVYIGDSNKVMDSLKEMKLSKDYKLVYLDYSKLKKDQKKDFRSETIELWKEGELTATYKFDKFNLKDDEDQNELKTVSLDEYLEQKDSEGLNIMFVGSDTCGYCDKFKESIKSLYEKYKADIYYINIATLEEDEYSELTESDDYFSSNEWGTPTSIVYYNGEKLDVIGGYIPVEDLTDVLNNNVGVKMFLKDNKVM